MSLRKCKECNSRPEIIKTKENFRIICCDEVKNKDRLKAINEWNELNKEFYYVFLIRYDVDEKNEKLQRSVDALMTLDSNELDEIRAAFMLSRMPIFDKKSFSERLEVHHVKIINNVAGIQARKRYDNKCSKQTYIMKIPVEISREELENIVKNMPKEKLEQYAVKGDVIKCIIN